MMVYPYNIIRREKVNVISQTCLEVTVLIGLSVNLEEMISAPLSIWKDRTLFILLVPVKQ